MWQRMFLKIPLFEELPLYEISSREGSPIRGIPIGDIPLGQSCQEIPAMELHGAILYKVIQKC